jgi:serine/threonine protein kinase
MAHPSDTLHPASEWLEYTGKALGNGQQAEIIEARLMGSLSRPVAVKIWKPEMSPERIVTERQLLMALQGTPGIARLMSWAGQSEVSDRIVLEMAHEGDLFNILEKLYDRTMSPALTRGHIHGILDQLLQAVKELHSIGFVHRDIKPENVLVYSITSTDIVIGLTDFGHAVRMKTQHTIDGTQKYLPPSCKDSWFHVYDGSEDLYGIAITVQTILRYLDPQIFQPEYAFVYKVMNASSYEIPSLLSKLDELRLNVSKPDKA